jgi:hypothetical protein
MNGPRVTDGTFFFFWIHISLPTSLLTVEYLKWIDRCWSIVLLLQLASFPKLRAIGHASSSITFYLFSIFFLLYFRHVYSVNSLFMLYSYIFHLTKNSNRIKRNNDGTFLCIRDARARDIIIFHSFLLSSVIAFHLLPLVKFLHFFTTPFLIIFD